MKNPEFKIGVFLVIQIGLIVLNALEVFDLPWAAVFMPTWLPFLAFVGFVVAVAVIGLCRAWRKSREATKSELYHD